MQTCLIKAPCRVSLGCHSHLRHACGFSLVELLVGMTVFAMAVAGIFSAIIQTTQMKETAAQELEASILLKNEMEHINGLNWQQIQALPDKGKFSTVPQGVTRYTAMRYVADPRPEQREIKLVISWQGSRGRTFTSSLVMLRTQYDV